MGLKKTPCNVCGKLCYGKECKECYGKGKFGGLARLKNKKKYRRNHL